MGIYWTIQQIEAWEKAKELGYLQGNMDYVWEEFVQPYQWMMEQMKKRISGYEGEVPVWVWVNRPDLRHKGHLMPKTRGVLLKVEIPDHQVLLSDFEAWHIVLNDGYLPLTEKEDECYDAGQGWMTKEESWERIFEIEALKRSPLWRGDSILQGTTGRLWLHQVKGVRKFVAR